MTAVSRALLALWISTSFSVHAAADSGAFASWIDSLELDVRVVAEMTRFAGNDLEWGEGYAADLASEIRSRIAGEAQAVLSEIAAGRSEPHLSVSFLDSESFSSRANGSRPAAEREFEAGFIRTEQLALFPDAELAPEEALCLFVSPKFRRETSSRISRLWIEDELSCIETRGIWGLLSPTFACNRIDTLVLDGVASEHSQVVANPGGEDFQIVFFKESLKTFVATPEGLVLHYINYTRSAKLGALKRKIGHGRIENSQMEKMAAFSELLAGHAAKSR